MIHKFWRREDPSYQCKMALRLALVTILAPMLSDTANQYYVEGAVAGDAGVTCEIFVDNSLQ